MGFQGNDDIVLGPGFGRIFRRRYARGPFFAVLDQLETVLLHRGQMRPAGDQGDVGAVQCQACPEIAADRAGAVDTDLHPAFPISSDQT